MSDSFAAYEVNEAGSEPLFSWKRATQFALLLSLAIVLARATMIELVRDPFQVAPGQAYAPLGTGPAVIVTLNLLSLLPALLVLLRRFFDPDYRLAKTLSPLFLVLLGVLALVSTRWSDDKFLTLISATTLFSAGVLCWSTAQLVRSWGRLRLVTALLVGLLIVYAAQGLFYRYVELPELQTAVEKSKDRILEERGFEPGTFAAEQFLRRISGGEVVGFGSSPNTYAAVIVLLGIVTAGLTVQGIVAKRDPVFLALPVGAVVLGAWCATFTHSNTAFATPVLAAVFALLAYALRKKLIAWRTPLFIASVLIVLLGIAAVVGHGLHHNSLPSDSLNFRWRYWVGSFSLFKDHPLAGVGYANFGPNYLAYRVPAAAEEIRDPHNFLVRFSTELGGIGLLLALLWQLRLWWEITRPATTAPELPSSIPGHRGLPLGALGFAGAVTLGVILNILSSVDFAADAPFVIVELFKRLMFLGAILVAGALSLIASRSSAAADESPAPWLLLSLNCAVAAFLLHNLIDFSLFENGPLFIFALLAGSAAGIRAPSEATSVARPVSVVTAILTAGAAVASIVLLLIPLMKAESAARAGDESLRLAVNPNMVGSTAQHLTAPPPEPSPQATAQAARHYRLAFEILPINSDYAYRAARAWLYSRSGIWEIRSMYEGAIKSNPKFILALLEFARFELTLPPTGETAGQPTKAIENYQRVIALNPTDIPIRLEYAATLEKRGRLEEARQEIQTALKYNDQLDPTEPKRLQPGQLEQVKAWLQRLP